MVLVSSTLLALAYVFLAVAALAGIVALPPITETVVSNRKTRLAQHESIRSYYGSFHLAR